MKPSDLSLTDDQFEDLWDRFDRTQATTRNVTIPKDAFFNLLRDHSTMFSEIFPTAYAVQKKPRK